MMLQYIRDNKKRKIGVLVALLSPEGKIVIGHSKWHRKLDKKYNIERGRQVAIERAEKDSTTSPALSFKDDYFKFVRRARSYFKDAEPSENTLESARRMTAELELLKRSSTLVKEAAAA